MLDYLGGFVVTAGPEEGKIADRFARANDDCSSILVKALADGFAEAFAERMHERVRKDARRKSEPAGRITIRSVSASL